MSQKVYCEYCSFSAQHSVFLGVTCLHFLFVYFSMYLLLFFQKVLKICRGFQTQAHRICCWFCLLYGGIGVGRTWLQNCHSPCSDLDLFLRLVVELLFCNFCTLYKKGIPCTPTPPPFFSHWLPFCLLPWHI